MVQENAKSIPQAQIGPTIPDPREGQEIIQELDKPFQVNDTSYALRDVILDIPFPLVFDEDTNYKLFNSVDVASKGEDAKQGFVHFTTYKDHSDIAKELSQHSQHTSGTF